KRDMRKKQRKKDIEKLKKDWLKFGFQGKVLDFISAINDDLLTKEEVEKITPQLSADDLKRIASEANKMAPEVIFPKSLFKQEKDNDGNITISLTDEFQQTLYSLEALKKLM